MASKGKGRSGTLPPGYEGVERTNIEKWETGMEVEGTFLMLEQSKQPGYSPIAKIREKGTGRVRKFGTPADLQYRLEGLPEKTEVFIRCTGKVPGTREDEWRFDVGAVPI